MKRLLPIVACVGLSLSAQADDESHPLIAGGYLEAVFNVSDIESQIRFQAGSALRPGREADTEFT